VHVSGRRLLPSMCAVTTREAARRGCLAGTSRRRQGPASLGRGRPQHAVDLALGTAAAAAPLPFCPFAPLCTVVACRGSHLAARSLTHVALLSRPRVCAASPRAWAPAACPPCAVASSALEGLSLSPSHCLHAADPLLRSSTSGHHFSIPLVHDFGLTSFGQVTPPRLESRLGRRQFWHFPSGEPIRAFRCASKGSRPTDRPATSLLLHLVRLEPLVALRTRAPPLPPLPHR
jgi:hypothetical protein